jgi:hypothetical protein
MAWMFAIVLPVWALGLFAVYSMCRVSHAPTPSPLDGKQPAGRDRATEFSADILEASRK